MGAGSRTNLRWLFFTFSFLFGKSTCRRCGRWLRVSHAFCATNHVWIDKDHTTKQGVVPKIRVNFSSSLRIYFNVLPTRVEKWSSWKKLPSGHYVYKNRINFNRCMCVCFSFKVQGEDSKAGQVCLDWIFKNMTIAP